MSSSDFRQLALKGEAGRSERLFRAAVSAFCSLTRPSRRDIKQLEDLVLPLFDTVSVEARRFAAAALSECADAPGALIRRLSNEAVDIAAPLLIRSKVLRDIDLIALIGRHGLPHARAIARRADLNPAIADLVWALENPKLVRLPLPKERQAQVEAASRAQILNDGNPEPVPGISADNARRRLRSMMVPVQTTPDATTEQSAGSLRYAKLRDMALTGNPAFFQTALADAGQIDFPTAKSITEKANHPELIAVLHSLELSEEQAFLIAACVYPGKFADPESIRLFLYSYRNMQPDAARQSVKTLKAGSPSTPVSLQTVTRSAAG
ncbi:DUF2336 domain-containing protein [Mesorhizobium sp. DCY119]|uniref:DUF2336 domain-containing protein n=1 Tax=Mesorhizobium sp. DCY119 TaxID=2108445 RepID=UPI000E6C5D25|nr:DUF2336 domain-containing protein [Mesorhizobium sp. DCY119]RJG45906.1 DUF2336 domain-containing protein [Mesorhizobium sp. DCY119]